MSVIELAPVADGDRVEFLYWRDHDLPQWEAIGHTLAEGFFGLGFQWQFGDVFGPDAGPTPDGATSLFQMHECFVTAPISNLELLLFAAYNNDPIVTFYNTFVIKADGVEYVQDLQSIFSNTGLFFSLDFPLDFTQDPMVPWTKERINTMQFGIRCDAAHEGDATTFYNTLRVRLTTPAAHRRKQVMWMQTPQGPRAR